MARWLLQRRLTKVSASLRRAREDLAVLDEQVAHLDGEADDLRLRSVVADSPMAAHEHRESQRHADAMRRAREDLAARIDVLARDQDRLLGQLAEAIR